jgi:hypothetical protein
MKILMIALVLLGLYLVWPERRSSNKSGESNASSSSLSEGSTETLAITFDTNKELIQKLRQVRMGQKIEMKPNHPGQLVNTGIQCNDAESKAAYLKKMNEQLTEENRLIKAELDRIYGQGSPNGR